MAFAIAAGRHPKFPTHQPITKSMYFLPRESMTMLPFVAATCSSAGSSLASGLRRRAGINDAFPWPAVATESSLADRRLAGHGVAMPRSRWGGA
jgi:hypothetical protein